MLRQLNLQIISSPGKIWPISVSLLLHGMILVLIAMPHAPKATDFITVELQSMPQFSVPASAPKAVSQNAAAAAPDEAKVRTSANPAVMPEPVKPVSRPALPLSQAVSAPAASQAPATGGRNAGHGAKIGSAPVKAGPGAKAVPVEGTFGASDGPSFVHSVPPTYPRMARKLEREGTVLLRISLDEKGALTSVVVVEKAGYGFDEAAMNAVKASRFRAAKQHGAAVACRALLPIRFKLEG